MKRIKIMLLSLLVVGAVGGAVAFKASKFRDTYYCGTTTNSCSTKFVNYKTTDFPLGVFNSYCSTTTSTTCPFSVTTDL